MLWLGACVAAALFWDSVAGKINGWCWWCQRQREWQGKLREWTQLDLHVLDCAWVWCSMHSKSSIYILANLWTCQGSLANPMCRSERCASKPEVLGQGNQTGIKHRSILARVYVCNANRTCFSWTILSFKVPSFFFKGSCVLGPEKTHILLCTRQKRTEESRWPWFETRLLADARPVDECIICKLEQRCSHFGLQGAFRIFHFAELPKMPFGIEHLCQLEVGSSASINSAFSAQKRCVLWSIDKQSQFLVKGSYAVESIHSSYCAAAKSNSFVGLCFQPCMNSQLAGTSKNLEC